MSSATEHPVYLHHHFSEAAQQHESSKLGMWLFLVTEILLFGGLFMVYAIFRAWNPEMFHNANQFLDRNLGTLNTAVLITSSVTMALAIRSMQLGRRAQTLRYLAATFLFALAFLAVKYFEYSHKFHEGQLPGKFYTFTEIQGTNPHIFFSIYFAMTGLHGIHVLAGMTAIAWIFFRTKKNHFSPEYYTPIELTGLYWHLVDMIWIFLFPLLYLIG